VSGGWLLQQGVSDQKNIYEQARVFDEVMTLHLRALRRPPRSGDLYRMATEGMIEELGDPHTSFLTPRSSTSSTPRCPASTPGSGRRSWSATGG
jgi:carboxyl-terminal processing protease